MEHLLSIIILFPAIGALLGLLVDTKSIKTYGITISVIEFCLTLFLWVSFDSKAIGFQFQEIYSLIPSYGVNFHLGVDGISIFLIVLSSFMAMLSMIGLQEKRDIKHLIITILMLEMTMTGVFAALDTILFYIFWEFSLVPVLYVIGGWGGKNRIYASVKFFIFTFSGSIIMLIGILFLSHYYYTQTGTWSFSITDWFNVSLPYNIQLWLFGAFFLGFAIKIPMVPFHTWLPSAHTEAPTIGSVILASILLKMGSYGFIRFSLPLFPDATVYFVYPIAILAIIMIVYTSFVAFAQKNIKQMIAYSSIAHMGVITLGTFALNSEGITGSIFLMLGHGIVSGGLFLLVGMLYNRVHSKEIDAFSGLSTIMPMYAFMFAIMIIASVAFPMTINFVGEFLIFLGFFQVSPTLTIIAASAIVMGAIYSLYLFRKVFFGKLKDEHKILKDLNKNELFTMVPIVVMTLALGIYPKPITDTIDTSVKHTLSIMKERAVLEETKRLINE
ncbi:MAG: NADH-ubiquinone oxidoreductase chain M (EC [uncultured Campylobacterales bacterium]|uniref:NADH-ubiquinone oxidoreductase chain M (EC) n=1 Tax=uncultured Campylobacterales bacterium TaxID=352960 RepID=A0A6S6S0N9_9BACT|nr:MAG: NADH-ubiquinone oxidoreductase chain M (EC [uncultured Campylobacterales bacterium]